MSSQPRSKKLRRELKRERIPERNRKPSPKPSHKIEPSYRDSAFMESLPARPNTSIRLSVCGVRK
jgi:hypothetical protein